jgi:hypothetical protein
MDVNRRNLMKGILASGTLATLGIPGFATAGLSQAKGPATDTIKARTCALLLGNTRVDDAFAKGASAAHLACSATFEDTLAEILALEVVKLKKRAAG